MAKIQVTRVTFSNYISNNIQQMGIAGSFADILSGGTLKDKLKEVPDEEDILIDTKYVYAVSPPVQIKETGQSVFQIYLSGVSKEDSTMWIKKDDYARFVKEWAVED